MLTYVNERVHEVAQISIAVLTGGSNTAHSPIFDERRRDRNCESFVEAALEILDTKNN